MDINNAPQPAANRGTENDRLFHQNYSPGRFGAGVRRLFVRLSALSSSSSFAFSAEAQQMCTGDAFRLCSSEIPNIPRITACMIKQRANLSSGCRAVLDRDLKEARKLAAQ
jgi:hypothetical protein